MPYANNPVDGARIYYEMLGSSGPTILLHHGFTGSGAEWKPGYSDALGKDHAVVLMDARGHGQSDKPHDPGAYVMENRVRDVTAVLDAVGADQVHFLGYSMGGQVGFGIARYAPQRLCSLIVGGIHPYAQDREAMLAQADGLATGMETYVAQLEDTWGRLPEPLRSELLVNDGNALAAVMRNSQGLDLDVSLEDYAFPTLIYCGDKDPAYEGARRAASEISNAVFATLEGLSHLEAYLRSDQALPHIIKFLRAD